MSTGRSANLSKGYIKLNLIYTTEAFLYLLAGLLAMAFSLLESFRINTDSIYILWLFGFVVSMVFGITNIMIPSYGNRKEFRSSVVTAEIILLNAGTIGTFVGFNDLSRSYLVFLGLILLILAVMTHLIDLSSSRV